MAKSVTIYGLATCDTTRAARKWLDAKGVAYAFHDVREDGLVHVRPLRGPVTRQRLAELIERS